MSEPKRVIVCGSRDFDDREIIRHVIGRLSSNCLVITGGAKGADSLAEQAATKRVQEGMEVETYYPDWKTHGKAAGPIRNQEMLDEGKPDLVIAFFKAGSPSKGTRDMVARARNADIPVEVHHA